MGYGNNGGQKFEPKPGQGTLFIKGQKRGNQSPDYDGYFIADRVIQPGEKIKLVGWDKQSGMGNMITLKVGREPQNMPQGQMGFGQRPQQYSNPNGNYNGNPNNGFGNAGNTNGYGQRFGGGQPPQHQSWQPGSFQPPQGSMQPHPAQNPTSYPTPPAGQYVPPGPSGSGAPPPTEENLPF